MKIKLWEDTNIKTYGDVRRAYNWCATTLGMPDGIRWKYGKDTPDFLGSFIISSPEEIEFIEFFDEQDAVAFKLIF